MKIKYVGVEEKKTQAQSGKVYIFSPKNSVQDIEEKDLQEHLLNKCGDRFMKEGELPAEPVEKKEEAPEGEKKKKKGRRKKQ